ncbi:MAG TPA: UDP-N-acetylglucosamine 1-carboxyvinyltransferase [Acidobacteriota bacterium]|nr:UDP-N-acetylglucosamine 1-carboxyvinyltransferase [Acidobacteriota bacterium]
MDRFLIHGGKKLSGSVGVSGAKNAALPQMAAALLTAEPVVLKNVPDLRDIDSMILLLEHLGAEVRRDGQSLEIRAAELNGCDAPYDIVRKMRASVVVLGPLLARAGKTRVSQPGGCAIGARPIDLHISAMQHLGADVRLEHGYIVAEAERLVGGEIMFDKVTVTGTENAMMAAVLARGQTNLLNCAMEPEVVDLGRLLQKMGAGIEGLGTPTIRVEGVESLRGAEHGIAPDRIEAATYVVAGLITGGEVEVTDCDPQIMRSVLDKLIDCGARLEIESNSVTTRPSQIFSQDVRTSPYPGFPTDMQAQYIALMTQAQGSAVVTENIFENRFMHIPELNRMGADIQVDGKSAVVRGPTPLSGVRVMATDLRASASLVLAALVAEGSTSVNRVYHIDRGYSHIVRKLRALGADIERIKE